MGLVNRRCDRLRRQVLLWSAVSLVLILTEVRLGIVADVALTCLAFALLYLCFQLVVEWPRIPTAVREPARLYAAEFYITLAAACMSLVAFAGTEIELLRVRSDAVTFAARIGVVIALVTIGIILSPLVSSVSRQLSRRLELGAAVATLMSAVLVWQAVQNSITTATVLRSLAEDHDATIRRAAARLQATPTAVLEKLAEEDPDATVQRAAIETLIAAYSDALEVQSRDDRPLEWAATQNNLGNALLSLGEHEGDTRRLEAAAAAYSDASRCNRVTTGLWNGPRRETTSATRCCPWESTRAIQDAWKPPSRPTRTPSRCNRVTTGLWNGPRRETTSATRWCPWESTRAIQDTWKPPSQPTRTPSRCARASARRWNGPRQEATSATRY